MSFIYLSPCIHANIYLNVRDSTKFLLVLYFQYVFEFNITFMYNLYLKMF